MISHAPLVFSPCWLLENSGLYKKAALELSPKMKEISTFEGIQLRAFGSQSVKFGASQRVKICLI